MISNLTELNSTWLDNSTVEIGTPTGNPLAVAIVLSIANIASIIVGTWGNLLVIVVVVCNRGLHSSTSFFIASLATADLIVTSICMPIFYVYNVVTWPVWYLGSAVCKVSSYLVHTSVMASALSLLAISYDRFLSVCFPMKMIMTMKRAKFVVTFIWCTSPCLLLGSLLHHDVVPMKYKGGYVLRCIETWDTVGQLHQYQMYRIFFYFLFVLQISVLYMAIGLKLYKRKLPGVQSIQGRAKLYNEKKKILKMLFSVVLLFSLSWLPYVLNKLLNISPPFKNYQVPDVFVVVGNFLALFNSVLNPIIYAALNRNFRTAFKHAIRCHCKYETEERRRTQSVVSLRFRNTQQTKEEKQCRAGYASRIANESTRFEGTKKPFINSFELTTDKKCEMQVRCLSFSINNKGHATAENDRILINAAIEKCNPKREVTFVHDGNHCQQCKKIEGLDSRKENHRRFKDECKDNNGFCNTKL